MDEHVKMFEKYDTWREKEYAEFSAAKLVLHHKFLMVFAKQLSLALIKNIFIVVWAFFCFVFQFHFRSCALEMFLLGPYNVNASRLELCLVCRHK